MRAAPTFVVMFFLLNVLPHRDALSGVVIVAVSLVPYAAAYVADSGADALRQFHSGSPLAGLLILPNIARAFFVLVMSSSAGAAIGVPEGIAIILRQAEKMPSTGDMLVLFAIGIACFGIPVAGRLCRHPPDSAPPGSRRSAQPNARTGRRQDFTRRIVMARFEALAP